MTAMTTTHATSFYATSLFMDTMTAATKGGKKTDFNSMPDDEIRLHIGKVCGWSLRQRIIHNGEWVEYPTWYEPCFADKPEDYTPAGQTVGTLPPNYPGKLEAMQKAEAILTSDQQEIFGKRLQELVLTDKTEAEDRGDEDVCRLNRLGYFALGQLKPRQRAVAFLRAVYPNGLPA